MMRMRRDSWKLFRQSLEKSGAVRAWQVLPYHPKDNQVECWNTEASPVIVHVHPTGGFDAFVSRKR